MGVYIIVIRGRKRIRKFFKNEEFGRKAFPIIKEKFNSAEVYFATTHAAECTPPATFIPRYPFQTWCPYCGAVTRFKKNPVHDTYNCQVCGISDQDFHVRCYNKLWALEKLTGGKQNSRIGRKVMKTLVQSKGNEGVDALTEDPTARKKRLRKERRKNREANKDT